MTHAIYNRIAGIGTLIAVIGAPALGSGLINGAFEAPRICAWEGRRSQGAPSSALQVVSSGGNPCSYLKMDSGEEDTYRLIAWQEFAISADVGEWVVLEFDAYVTGDEDQTTVQFDLDPGGSAEGLVPDNQKWDHYVLAIQVDSGEEDPDVSVTFGVCGDGTLAKFDNVECYVQATEPSQSILESPNACFYPDAIVGLDRDAGWPCCPEDCSPALPDGVVDVNDLFFLLGQWGSSCSQADVNGDGTVDVEDLNAVIGAWGSCP